MNLNQLAAEVAVLKSRVDRIEVDHRAMTEALREQARAIRSVESTMQQQGADLGHLLETLQEVRKRLDTWPSPAPSDRKAIAAVGGGGALFGAFLAKVAAYFGIVP